MTATLAAFNRFREEFGPAREPEANLIESDEERIQLTEEHGLRVWTDGPVEDKDRPKSSPSAPRINPSDISRDLWVIRDDDVVYAKENCDFGKYLPKAVIKHTNLTAGGPAYGGGELLIRGSKTVIVNGRSGRYGPRSAEEMEAVAVAFRKSGYHVWTMGYDQEANRPFPFVGAAPQWVP